MVMIMGFWRVADERPDDWHACSSTYSIAARLQTTDGILLCNHFGDYLDRSIDAVLSIAFNCFETVSLGGLAKCRASNVANALSAKHRSRTELKRDAITDRSGGKG